jgi:hypothetical protein
LLIGVAFVVALACAATEEERQRAYEASDADCQRLRERTLPSAAAVGDPDHRLLLKSAIEAYHDEASAACWTRNEVKVTVTRDEHTGAWVLAWRGTALDRVSDLLLDMEIMPINHPTLGLVHSGFLRGMMSVAEAVANDVAGREQQVVLTGHSLGGAMALLFGAWMASQGRPVHSIVTFGAPRFARRQVAELLRYTPGVDYCTAGDPVCNSWSWIYKHPRPVRNVHVPDSLGVALGPGDEDIMGEILAMEPRRGPRLRFLDLFFEHLGFSYWSAVSADATESPPKKPRRRF